MTRNKLSAISDQRSAIGDQPSAISVQRSAIGDQRSAIGSQRSRNLEPAIPLVRHPRASGGPGFVSSNLDPRSCGDDDLGTQYSVLSTSHSSSITYHSSLARAVTLVEILVVVAIIGVLLAAIGLVGSRLREKGKRDLTRGTMATLTLAIDEFQQAANGLGTGGWIEANGWPSPPNDPHRTNTAEPPPAPDVHERPYEPSQTTHAPPTQDDFYLGYPDSIFEVPPAASPTMPAHRVVRSIEGLYVILQFPYGGSSFVVNGEARDKIRAILRRLPQGATVNAHGAMLFRPHVPTRDQATAPFVEALQVLDAWQQPLRYRYYTYRNNGRPFLWSAGPDGRFAADPNRVDQDPVGADDIFSDKKD